MERERPNDYLFFVRSGYSGSQAYVPAVWGGDAEANFDDTQGIPSALRSGLSLGMSGVPYWGSDGTGFKCLTNAPRDKEVYLRWAQLMAVSPIFMEQNACVDPLDPGQTKWTLWSDDETTAHYGEMARLHTRLQPYFQTLAVEAQHSGMPLMRDLFLVHPQRKEALTADETFLLGPALLASPVVRRGQTEKQTWLPPGRFVDLADGTVFDGGRQVTLPAPLLKLPLLLVEGEIVPLLDASIETLAESTVPGVISPSDVADRLDAWVALDLSGSAELTLADGTVLSARPGTADAPASMSSTSFGDVIRFDAESLFAAQTEISVDGTVLSATGAIARRMRWTLYRTPLPVE
jgi:alpha-glucosidase (family GH31 glycosyl hydrolase)